MYAPLALDASISNISSPIMPFSAGTHNIEASLSNTGGSVITSATIKWSLDGVLQSIYSFILQICADTLLWMQTTFVSVVLWISDWLDSWLCVQFDEMVITFRVLDSFDWWLWM